jgi:hypothetical protein
MNQYINKPNSYKFAHHIIKSVAYTPANQGYQSEDGRFETWITEIDREKKIHRHYIKVLK